MSRADGRAPDELRPVLLERGFVRQAAGSVLARAGETIVLCTASVDPRAPAWLAGKGRGWVTAEYGMLPGSTQPRKPRERDGKTDGRSVEIQRLIGRSLRAVTDLAALGERTITLDCDVLQADGGTRTLCITAAWVALADAVRSLAPELPEPTRCPLTDSVAAVSVGRVADRLLVDLDYREDAAAEVDANVVLTGSGRFVEVQATGEEATYGRGEIEALLDLAGQAVRELARRQREALGPDWPGF